jgi:hypothetical protein
MLRTAYRMKRHSCCFYLEVSQADDTTTGKSPAIPTGGLFQGQPRSRLHDRDTVSREADRNGEQPGLISAVAAAQSRLGVSRPVAGMVAADEELVQRQVAAG